MTGADRNVVHVVLGERAPLTLPAAVATAKIARSELTELTEEALWERLAAVPELQAVARRLHREERVRWSEWRAVAGRVLVEGDGGGEAGARDLLAACTRAKRPVGREAFLPVRMHVFERTLGGLWACCDGACPERPRGEDADWPFGKVFIDPRETCDTCESPVLEVRVCRACGTEMLAAEESDGRLSAPTPEEINDDFAFDLDLPDSDVDERAEHETTPALRIQRWVMSEMAPGRIRLAVRRGTGEILDTAAPDALVLATADGGFDGDCPACGEHRDKQPAVRPFRVGAPFLLGASVPVALGAVTADPDAAGKPFAGRRLITFTDARQGTARLSAKLQGDGERAFVRAFVYHAVQVKPPGGSAREIEDQRNAVTTLGALVATNPQLRDVLARERHKLDALEGASPPGPIPWNDLRDRLAQDPTILHLKNVWEDREPAFENPGDLAHFLLLREFLRRAVHGNSAETMGLVRLVIPGHGAQPPASAHQLGLSAGDWQALLHLIVTHFLRLNTIVSIAPWAFNWIDRRPRHVAIGQFEQRTQTEFPWPAARGSARPSRIVSLMAQATGVSLDDRRGCDLLNETLEETHRALQRYLEPAQGGGSRLDMRRLSLASVKDAWLCPVTRRVIDATLKELSPYPRRDGRHLRAEPLRLPDLLSPFPSPESAAAEIEPFLRSDADVRHLRELGVWSEFHDRAALFTPYFRSAEHSAQQPSWRLRAYEDMFKEGDVNVLNCSTTMELGVDIGSLELVVNANVPPSIANYRQRAGRAGRRDQPVAAALTLCKERPVDRRAFDDPTGYLDTRLRPPRVRLDSAVIARRHAFALLLSAFLRERKDDALHIDVSSFFGFELTEETPAPWRDFLQWCDETDARLRDQGDALAAVLAGTPVSVDRMLFKQARDDLTRIAEERRLEWDALLRQEAGAKGDEPARRAIRYQKERLKRAYLLSELAAEGFLPGYGFPTGIVPFITGRRDKERPRVDVWARSRDYPSRQLDVALFEYAPGAPVVLDGLVYKSDGITLNWRAPAQAEGVREIQALRTAWRCRTCGTAGVTSSAAKPDICPCGSANLETQEHIVPSGFTVDFGDNPHDDPVEISYLPRQAPWVHASGGDWVALPASGRVRASPSGIVHFSNTGRAGHGYALCLQCGRAAPETEPEGMGEPPFDDSRGGHRPLHGARRGDRGLCPGSTGNFSIKRSLALGYSLRTAVVEVQLDDCRDSDTALAVAVALREACALELGVDPEDMGFAATPTPSPSGGVAWCSVVYDRAKGGAGFAPTIADDPVRCLRSARDLLDCRRPGRCRDPEAERFCTRCLLSADTQWLVARCNRRVAFDLLNDLVPRLQ